MHSHDIDAVSGLQNFYLELYVSQDVQVVAYCLAAVLGYLFPYGMTYSRSSAAVGRLAVELLVLLGLVV